LSDEMYNALMQEFASEKILKQKVEQIKEAKQEKRLHQEESHEQDDEEFVSAEQLRKGYLEGRKDALHPKSETGADVPKEEADSRYPGLKVKGKIDLDSLSGKRPKPQEVPQHKPVVEPVAKAKDPVETPKVETPVVEVAPKVEEPKVEVKPVVVEVPKVEVPKVEEPVVEQPKVEVAPVIEPKVVVEEPKVTETVVPVVAETPAEVVAPEADAEVTEEQGVVRAADHSPKLAGLNIKGKIDLDALSGRKPKPKLATAGAAATPGSSEESEEDKKKRRRKRKRKKPSALPGTPGAQGQAGTGQPGSKPAAGAAGAKRPQVGAVADKKKKDDASAKELNDVIKRTLENMRQGASRSRQRLRKGKRDSDARRRENEAQHRAEEALILEVTEFITANELANMMDIPVTEIIAKCMELGLFVSINQRLEADVIQLLAEEYDFTVRFIDIADKAFDEAEAEHDDESKLLHRAPIITVMGHVDHGKTSLLDYIRKANIVAGEAGGITQHIGAYEVVMDDGRRICFLDTPGHEAFTAMRARGAKVTDLVIIVIAADDQVMPQTREAINHAEAAGVPMVFAINKIDKAGANSEKIRLQLSEMNILVEDWGGKFQCQEISAKSGLGIPELLEKVLLEAEMLDLKANPDKPARGTVIEARLDKGRGVVATVLVQDGSLEVGDSMVAGVHFARVRAMQDERGKRIKKVGPSTPVQLIGLAGTPQAGDRFVVYEEERKAKDIALRRSELYREQQLRQNKRPTLEEIARRKALGDFRELNIIVKGDVDGSVEALSDSLLKLSQGEVAVKVIHKAVGQITEADVLLATASDAIIIGFQVRPSPNARKMAETEGIDIRLYSIIYDAINQVRDALEGLLSPEKKEEITGTAEIREIFKVTKVGTIAGCMVVDGEINRKDPVRLIRDGIVIHQGRLASLKRFKDDVREVKRGFDCGMQIDGYNDIQERDVIEQFKTTEVARKLL
ncbi:MAG TPA: translation initiation factor IF-2, partial [Bacteroidia bacterium]|nr:translation initiation factor IF-2 [Bacteroidia bacterium]